MADFETVGLLEEHGCLHGIKLVGERGATTVSAARKWMLPSSITGDSGEDADDGNGTETVTSTAAWHEVLAQARADLKIDDGFSLALSSHNVIVKVLRLPPIEQDDLHDIVRLQMEKIAPQAGENLSVGYEVLAQEEEGIRVFAAAAPQEFLDELAEHLRQANLRLKRLDVALLSWWRQLIANDSLLPPGTVMVLFEEQGYWDWILEREGIIVQARGFGLLHTPADLSREVTLSLLNHEMETERLALDNVIVVAEKDPGREWLTALTSVLPAGVQPTWVERGRLGKAALGLAQRDSEPGVLDLIPIRWRRQERESIQRRRLLLGFLGGVALWLLLFAVLYSLPRFVEQRTATIERRIKTDERRYRTVSDTRQRVRLIRSYMDRSQSLLEVLRELSIAMPEGLEFSAVTYRRDDTLKIAGDAGYSSLVYDLKDAMDSTGRYQSTRLTGPTLDGARRRYRYEIDARFKENAE